MSVTPTDRSMAPWRLMFIKNLEGAKDSKKTSHFLYMGMSGFDGRAELMGRR